METLKFKIEINAPKEKVWDTLWNDYRQWATIFCEGTYAVSDWNEGSKVHFISPSGDGINSIIDSKIDYEYMAFKHISELKNFVEMPIDSATQEWNGGMETYKLTAKENGTVLEVSMDCIEKYVDYFKEIFPNALEMVKKLSEKQ